MSTSDKNRVDLSFEVQERDGRYVLTSREFGVVVETADLVAGAAEIRDRISALKDEHRVFGAALPQQPQEAAGFGETGDTSRKLNQIVAESVIRATVTAAVFGILLLLVMLPVVFAASNLRHTLSAVIPERRNVDAIGHAAIDVVVRLGDAAEQLTPEREKELHSAVRRIAQKIIPLINTARDPQSDEGTAAVPERR